jgi:hypothetical protein
MPTWTLPALFAALVAIGATIVIERLGGKRGGLVGSLPTTIVPASIGFHSVSATIGDFQDALFITPAGMLVNALFLLMWRVVPPRLPPLHTYIRLAMCVVITMTGWLLMALAAIEVTRNIEVVGLNRNSWAVVLTLTMATLGILACKRNPPAPRASSHAGVTAIVIRGLVAGCAIGGAVWLANHGGPLIAGVAAVFPAIFMTTLCSLWLSHGESVGAGAIGPLMLGGTSVSAYSWFAACWVPTMGIGAGSAAAWVVAVLVVTVPAWMWLKRQN